MNKPTKIIQASILSQYFLFSCFPNFLSLSLSLSLSLPPSNAVKLGDDMSHAGTESGSQELRPVL